MHSFLFAPFLLLGASSVALPNDVGSVIAHPPVDAFFSCTEHFEGQFKSVGDALGTDCVVVRLVEKQGRAWLRAYEEGGEKNDEWYGWHEHLLSPCDCKVIEVYETLKAMSLGLWVKGGRRASRFVGPTA